jgi:hypothetical protein
MQKKSTLSTGTAGISTTAVHYLRTHTLAGALLSAISKPIPVHANIHHLFGAGSHFVIKFESMGASALTFTAKSRRLFC